MRRVLARTVWAFAAWMVAYAEELPVRAHTDADGVGPDDVLAIRGDSHGYVRIGTG